MICLIRVYQILKYYGGTWRNVQLLDAHDGLVKVVVNSNFEAFGSIGNISIS